MDDYNYSFEEDVLFRNEITGTDKPNIFTITKVPVLTREVFEECMRRWGKGGEDDTTAK